MTFDWYHANAIALKSLNLGGNASFVPLITILNLNKYEEINFELLLGYAVYIIHYFFDNKKKLIIKHRNNVFELNSSQNSLNKILKYLSNVEK